MEYNILNHTKDVSSFIQDTVPPLDISLKLQRSMLQLKGHHMTEDGRGVDYERLRESELFRDYIDLSIRLVACDPSSLDHQHRMAFFISILILLISCCHSYNHVLKSLPMLCDFYYTVGKGSS